MAIQQKSDNGNCKQQQKQKQQKHLALPMELHQEVNNWIPPPTIYSNAEVILLEEQREQQRNVSTANETKNHQRFMRIYFIKELLLHLMLLAVLIGYLCAGAFILQALESRTELETRSRKLIRLGNLIENFTAQSWEQLQNSAANKDQGQMANSKEQWAAMVRDYMISASVAQEMEDNNKRRSILRQEMLALEHLDNLHNKWTFPTARKKIFAFFLLSTKTFFFQKQWPHALKQCFFTISALLSVLYVLTVLITCGYSEVSVQTDMGKLFSFAFALVGMPLMFMTAKEICNMFLPTIIKRSIKQSRRVKRLIYECFRRKRLQQSLEIGNDNGEKNRDTLWFAVKFYVLCICLYCSLGSLMFMCWQDQRSFLHAFHFGFNLITIGLGDFVVTDDYLLLCLIVAFAIIGFALVIMCIEGVSNSMIKCFSEMRDRMLDEFHESPMNDDNDDDVVVGMFD